MTPKPIMVEAKEGPARQETDQGRQPARPSAQPGDLDRRDEQGPEAGRDHDARREAEHGVEKGRRQPPKGKDEHRSHGRHQPGHPAHEDHLTNRVELDEPIRQLSDIHL